MDKAWNDLADEFKALNKVSLEFYSINDGPPHGWRVFAEFNDAMQDDFRNIAARAAIKLSGNDDPELWFAYLLQRFPGFAKLVHNLPIVELPGDRFRAEYELKRAAELSKDAARALAGPETTPVVQQPERQRQPMTLRTFWDAAWSLYNPLGQPGHDVMSAAKRWQEHDAEFQLVNWRRHLSAERADRLLAAVGAMRENVELVAFDARRPVERRTPIRDFKEELATLLETSRMENRNFAELASSGGEERGTVPASMITEIIQRVTVPILKAASAAAATVPAEPGPDDLTLTLKGFENVTGIKAQTVKNWGNLPDPVGTGKHGANIYRYNALVARAKEQTNRAGEIFPTPDEAKKYLREADQLSKSDT